MTLGIKKKIKQIIADSYYWLYLKGIIKLSHKIEVATIDETIDMLLNTNNSLVRFGDGELTVIRGRAIKIQKQQGNISERLKEVLAFKEDGLKVAIVDMFDGLDSYVPKSQKFWKDHFLFCSKYYSELTNPNKKYYNAFFSRCYITLKDKSKSSNWFEKIKLIWKQKKIVVVEGTTSKNGVFDDLFTDCVSVERVIGPSTSAYELYDEILSKCMSMDRDKLFLLSLGPTAKPLALDLHKAGYRVIDIGNLDLEYQFFLNGVDSKDAVKKEYYDPNSDFYKECMERYNSQILYSIER